MDVSIQDIEPHRVINISGDVDLYNVQELKDVLYGAIDENIQSLVVDMKDIFYMDSSGIGALLGAHKKMKKQGGFFSLANMQKETWEVFRLASLHNFFSIFENTDQTYSNIPFPSSPQGKTAQSPTISHSANQKKIDNLKPSARQDNNKGNETIDFNENFDDFRQSQKKSDDEPVIFKGWVDDDTFRLPVDGYPREETRDILARKMEAKDRAIRRAHMIALEYFVRYCKSKTWVVFHNYRRHVYKTYKGIVQQGVAKFSKFDSKQNCTIIFEIKHPQLKIELLHVAKSFNKSRLNIAKE